MRLRTFLVERRLARLSRKKSDTDTAFEEDTTAFTTQKIIRSRKFVLRPLQTKSLDPERGTEHTVKKRDKSYYEKAHEDAFRKVILMLKKGATVLREKSIAECLCINEQS